MNINTRILATVLVFLSFTGSWAQDISLDQKLGAENALLVPLQMGIYENEPLRIYVQKVVDRLVTQLGPQPFEYTVKLVDQEEPNAFALPAGFVFVTRGLLTIVNSEDELAGILAHEIVHSHNRHAIKQMKKKRPIVKGLLQLPGRFVGVFLHNIGDLMVFTVEAGSAVVQANYSRKHEKEADMLGVQLMARAGYDPAALGTVLGTLSREIEYMTGEEERSTLLDDHPITPKRVTYLAKAVEELQPAGVASISSNFLGELDGLLFGPNPEQGITRKTEFLHPDLDIYLDFPPKWRTQNTPTALTAYNESQEAVVTMTLDQSREPLEARIKNMIDTLQNYAAVDVVGNGSVDINGNPAYQITLAATESGKQVFLDLVYITRNNLRYQFMAVSYPQYREEVLTGIGSFRGLTEEERNNIFSHYMTLGKAVMGDNITQLNERSGSYWGPEFGAIANGIELDQNLKKGQSYKVLSRERYESKQ